MHQNGQALCRGQPGPLKSVHIGFLPPVKIQAAPLLPRGRAKGHEPGGWEPGEIPTNPDGLLTERGSKRRKLNKSRKKVMKEKSPLRIKEVSFSKPLSEFSIYFFSAAPQEGNCIWEGHSAVCGNKAGPTALRCTCLPICMEIYVGSASAAPSFW